MTMDKNERTSAAPFGLQAIADRLWPTLARLAASKSTSRVLFTAPERGSGTSTIAAAAALGLAQNLRVAIALVETDLERPSLADTLSLASSPGLSDVLEGKTPLASALQSVDGVPGLRVLTAGTPRAPIAGELATSMARALFAELTQMHRLVFFDAAPALDSSSARLLCQQVDGAVLVIRAGETHKERAAESLRAIDGAGAHLIGTIVNRYRSDLPFGIGERMAG